MVTVGAIMFLEKNSRFFRRYHFSFKPKTKFAPALPLVASDKHYSIKDALVRARANKVAQAVQPNGDLVELVAIRDDDKNGVLTLLFHRSSPSAADPSYRKWIKDKLAVRQATKETDEEQAVSAHMVIRSKPSSPMTYDFALEEIPGLSISVIKPIFGTVLRGYEYPYEDKKGEDKETYTIVKSNGIKAEGLDSALKKKGSINYINLVRTNIPDAPDSDGIAEPQVERIKYKIVGDPSSPEWNAKLRKFIGKVRSEDWDDVYLELSLDDDRHRTVKVDREDEAAEILFVRSEQVAIKTELKPCTQSIIDEIVDAARTLLIK
ncbi:hypothetical protein [Sphingobium sp. IP1]|uniref:hypothetical protein n=1 Tax=Sphingobium sp. IP1 TaxID=2021637 RepID=UPI00117A9137|nr:hypothetical protein [Sphingobium sp. IP1]